MFFSMLFGSLIALAALLVLARRLTEGGAESRLSDDDVRRIVDDGLLVTEDEPLDLEHIAEEESRFWDEERWDQADPI